MRMIFSTNKSSLIPADVIVLFGAMFILATILFFIAARKIFKGKRMKSMGIWFLAWLGVATVLFSAGAFGRFVDVKTINSKTYTKNELTKDLKQLEKRIMNENPLYFTNKDELKQRFLAAYDQVEEGMTELEFYRLVNPIVASVSCGHTNLSISEALLKNREETAKFFPLKATLIANQLYITENDPANGIAAGDEIISINGKSSGEIINILIKNISGDGGNEAKPRYIISKHFNNKFYDFVDNSDQFHVVLLDKKGNSKSMDLKAKGREEFNTSAWSLHFADYGDGNYYESKLYEDYAVLRIRVFMEEKGNKFNAFLDDFFLKLKDQNISKLIIDARGNFGGNPKMAQALLSHFVKEETPYFDSDLPFLYNLMGYQKPISPAKTTFDGAIVVLTDGAGFSTTGHFSAFMKYHHLGTFVGSETGGTYVCTDSSKDTVLNHTRIRLHYSTLVYKVSVQGLTQNVGIAPDIAISPAIDDLLEHRDVQMERGLQVLQQ